MPCPCNVSNSKKEPGIRTVIIRNPKNGQKVAEIKIPIVKTVRNGPQLLPGSRIIKEETLRRYVTQPRRLKI